MSADSLMVEEFESRYCFRKNKRGKKKLDSVVFFGKLKIASLIMASTKINVILNNYYQQLLVKKTFLHNFGKIFKSFNWITFFFLKLSEETKVELRLH